jgi:hypothetical protein
MWDAGKFVYVGSVYYDDSALVKKFPMFFRPVEFAEDGRMMVEQTTAAPGERRNVVIPTPAVAEPEPEPEPEVEDDDRRPWTTASKEDWVRYAEALGIDCSELTKSGVIDAVEAAERGD